jgi:hypothetical protein
MSQTIMLLAKNVISRKVIYRAILLVDKNGIDTTCRNVVNFFYQILRYRVPENYAIGNKLYFP